MDWLYTKIKRELAEVDDDCQNCPVYLDYKYKFGFGTSVKVYQSNNKNFNCLKDRSFMYCARFGTQLPWAKSFEQQHILIDTEDSKDEQ